MKHTITLGWTTAILSFTFMIIGHMGDHELSWVSNQISTFAAQGPNAAWITASMFTSALTLLSLAVLITRYQLLGSSYLVHIVPLIIGAAVSGLVLLASFKETGISDIRQQSFHDAGLQVFFLCMLFFLLMAGCLCYASQPGVGGKVIGVILASLGVIALALLSVPWPKWLGLTDATIGLMQRASFFSMWFGVVLLLTLASNKQMQCRIGAGTNSH